MAFHKSSNPGRLYGLPKVHKSYTPLRSVLPALETFKYELGRRLAGILWDIINRKTLVSGSFSFVKDLQALFFFLENGIFWYGKLVSKCTSR
ncbi:unnamed protein product [Adineta steineri]|uniref:Uncharacterized protein n=1 Tax=Adineta steineri TaxID=433720 RepID=A0A819P7N1_9BILA|nr:unnamed protein product [Adineta steineri]CAF4006119.1 unnamed protein product [Adineta steineri]